MRTWLWTAPVLWLALAAAARAEEPAPKAKEAIEPAPADLTSAPVYTYTYTDMAPGPRMWFGAEYLLWWIQDHPVPEPLLSTGAIGAPGTLVVLGGGNDVPTDVRHGARLSAGAWLNDEGTLGVEASYFFLGRQSDTQLAASDPTGTPVLGFPFLAATGAGDFESFFTFSFPGVATDLTVLTISTELQGAEVNGLANAWSSSNLRVDVLGGFRYAYLREKLTLITASPGIAAGVVDFNLEDQLAATNNFFGGQVGARASWTSGRLFADLTAKFGLGNMHQEQSINGIFVTSGVGAPTATVGGTFTGPANVGKHDNTELGILYELTLNAGVNVNDSIRAFVGYNFLGLSNVIRPGEQIDRRIDVVNATPLFPAVKFSNNSFWAQGVNFGVEFRY